MLATTLMPGIRLLRALPHRTAMVAGQFLQLPRDAVTTLEDELIRQAQIGNPSWCRDGHDNHTVYTFRDGRNKEVAVFFTDLAAVFGTDVREGCW